MVEMNRTLAILGGKPLFPEPLHVGLPNLPDRDRFNELLDRMFANRWFTNYGPLVKEFQSLLEERLGVRHCIPLCNGTIALELAYRAIGLKGEVIVPSFTFIATPHALRWQEITPVFCDIREDDFTIDPGKIEDLITPRTSGIVGVHTYGNPCHHAAISEVARRHGLPVVYDAAHAFTNEVNGIPVCRLGDISVLSFHATKFFSTFEGGAVATDNDELAEKVRLMMNFGFAGKVKDRVDYIGTNGKMTEVCAAMGLAMLEKVDGIRECNRVNFEAYRETLDAIPGISLREPSPGLSRLNWQYVILTVDQDAYGLTRDGLVKVLEAENVLARRYFYPGCHRMEPYRNEFPNKCRLLPVTDRMAERVLSLPTGESVTPSTVEWIASTVRLAGEKAVEVTDRIKGEGSA
jgi:dTDP-4-amino-4,6-dideoxygalactose transaminase